MLQLKNLPILDKWNQIKTSFYIDTSYIHLALPMLASHPLEVQEAIDIHRRELNKNPTLYYRNKERLECEVLNKAAQYLHTDPIQIALTESTTMGLSVVYNGLSLKPGDEILTTSHEHYATCEILRFKSKRENCHLKIISLYEDPFTTTDEEIIEQVIKNITKKTRLLALTWVHSCTGVKIPINKIADKIALINETRKKEEKVLVVLDGVHGFGIEDFNVEKLGCDFFISGCHKWLFGPRGTGLVWGKKESWENVTPLMTSFKGDAFFAWFNQKDPDKECPRAHLSTPGGFQAYEHRWSLDKAFNFHLSIGKKDIEKRVHELNTYCKKELLEIPFVHLFTPISELLSSGIICFSVDGMPPHDVVEKFLEKGVIIGQTPYRTSYCRFMPGILNSENELDEAITVLRNLF